LRLMFVLLVIVVETSQMRFRPEGNRSKNRLPG